MLLLVGLPCAGCAQQPGSLDESFDVDGKLVIDQVWGEDPHVRAMQDRNLLLAFQTSENGTARAVVWKLLEDGQVDNTFANQGFLSIEGLGQLFDLLVTQDNGFLLFLKEEGTDGFHFRVLRFDSEGHADTSFAEAGGLHIPASSGIIQVSDVILLPDDRLLIAGRHSNPPAGWMGRWGPDGMVDLSFGVNGEYLSTSGPVYNSLAIQNMDHLYAAGNSIARLDMNGQSSLQPLGEITAWVDGPIVSNGYGVGAVPALSPITGAPGAPISIGLHRFAYNPELPSGNLGQLFTQIYMWPGFGGPATGTIHQMCADQAGNFLVASTKGFQPGWRIHRVQSFAVALDNAFANNGMATTTFSDSIATPSSMTVQDDGKLVVAGRCFVNGLNRIVLARYHNIPDPRARLALRFFLGGAYDPATGLQRDNLRQQGLVPLQQPYTAPHFMVGSDLGPSVTSPQVLQAVGDSAVVDWVLIDLISASDSATIAANRVGILHRDGWVTSADGRSPINFNAGAGVYFVRARHRNHLAVTSSQPLSLGAWVSSLDLTDPAVATFGVDAQQELDGRRMLWPGDVNSEGLVKYVGLFNDRDPILIAVGGSTPTNTVTGYLPADVNLDGTVKYVGNANDRELILQTLNGNVYLVRSEQRP